MKIENVMARVLVEHLEPAITFYQHLTHEAVRMRFSYGKLDIAAVGNFLIIEGPKEVTAPFGRTTATLKVDNLDGFVALVLASGGNLVRSPQEVPTGHNAVLRHPDGSMFEYVEHRTDRFPTNTDR